MGDEQRDVTEQAAVHGQIHPFGAAKARDGYLCGADLAAGGATADLTATKQTWRISLRVAALFDFGIVQLRSTRVPNGKRGAHHPSSSRMEKGELKPHPEPHLASAHEPRKPHSSSYGRRTVRRMPISSSPHAIHPRHAMPRHYNPDVIGT
ncbi:hypothetical protein BKA56DRAFT_616807 [Ilyonectria sp. MPI-CAGE-AT-0026]|nr:hypothetical protein BKA56DRAFT_616807 [Ilyonectria sp. MPI-CAGE-AT-0026]